MGLNPAEDGEGYELFGEINLKISDFSLFLVVVSCNTKAFVVVVSSSY